MTGSYASFKGKLKVGDRVRLVSGGMDMLNGREFLIEKTDGERFWIENVSKTEIPSDWRWWFLWEDPGTLELLSPSPRVVSLENLEPGDEVEKRDERMQVLDVAKNGKVYFMSYAYGAGSERSDSVYDSYSASDLQNKCWQPVQPASPPAPAEKEEEWWERKEYWTGGTDGDPLEYDVPKIIAEAKRRGAEEAWRECRFFVARMKLWSKGNVEGTRQDILAIFDAKIESLNKPVTPGEK